MQSVRLGYEKATAAPLRSSLAPILFCIPIPATLLKFAIKDTFPWLNAVTKLHYYQFEDISFIDACRAKCPIKN
jgi:hypothetical protein